MDPALGAIYNLIDEILYPNKEGWLMLADGVKANQTASGYTCDTLCIALDQWRDHNRFGADAISAIEYFATADNAQVDQALISVYDTFDFLLRNTTDLAGLAQRAPTIQKVTAPLRRMETCFTAGLEYREVLWNALTFEEMFHAPLSELTAANPPPGRDWSGVANALRRYHAQTSVVEYENQLLMFRHSPATKPHDVAEVNRYISRAVADVIAAIQKALPVAPHTGQPSYSGAAAPSPSPAPTPVLKTGTRRSTMSPAW